VPIPEDLFTNAVISAAPGLDFLVRQTVQPDGGERLELTTPAGSSAVLMFEGEEGGVVFSQGKAYFHRADRDAGVAFVNELAAWFGYEAAEGPATPLSSPRVTWVHLADGRDRLGVPWQTFKLFLSSGDKYAECFVRLTPDRLRGRITEKWSRYRADMLAILEHLIGAEPPRQWRPGTKTTQPPSLDTLGLPGGFEFTVPPGWKHQLAADGHWTMTDMRDDASIEVSTMPLPRLPPEAPTLPERVIAVVSGMDQAPGKVPSVQTAERDGVQFAWADYTFASRDTKDASGPERPACGRVLLFANEWVQAIVTAYWWPSDTDWFSRAFSEFVSSVKYAPAASSALNGGA
jgi:hypothetical protein